MKNTTITITVIALLLTGCRSSTTDGTASLEERLKNPLYGERYAEELVDRMVEFKIQDDPILEDEKKAGIIEKTRKEWLEKGATARQKQNEGFRGQLITMKEYTRGEVLYADNTLYTGTLFTTAPGPNLHFHLTTVVDPRDVEFPDETAIDIGVLYSAYGAQTFSVPPVEDPQQYRTVVLWDNDLERLYGFAQLSK